MIFSTITQNELTLSVDSYNLPTQNSNNIQLKFVQDTENFSGYTPTVAMSLLDSSLISCADVLNEGGFVPLQSDGTFLVQNNILSQDGFLAVAINLTKTTGSTTETVMLGPVVYKIQANISALSPLPPDDNLWQSVVTAFLQSVYDNDYKPQFDQIQQDLENLVTEAQQHQQTVEQQQTQIDNAISVMGEYQIVSNDPVQIQFKQGDGTYGPTVDLGDGLASKSMVNAGYYQSIGSQYSGSASDYGIQVEEIVGAYTQETTTGAQLLDISNVTDRFDTTHELTNTGLTVTGQYYVTVANIEVQPNTDMYISYEKSGAGVNQVSVYKAGTIASSDKIYSNEGTGGTFNTGDNSQVDILFYSAYGSSSSTYNNVMLCKGTQALPYEPYTGGEPSPSPDYAQEMQAVEISNLYSSGKNFFNKDDIDEEHSYINTDGTPTDTGVTVTGTYYVAYKVNVPKNTDMYISYEKSGSGTNLVSIYKTYPFTPQSYMKLFDGTKGGAFNTGENDSLYLLFYSGSGTSKTSTYSDIMLNVGDTAVPYTHYTGADTVTLSEPLVLRALPNGVCDTYENGVITRRVGVVEFDGSVDESWAKNGNADYTYHITLSDIALEEVSDGNDILSDRFIAKRSNTILSSGEFRRGGGNTVGNNILVFRYDGLATDDLTAWRTWIKSNPVTVWYELATPTTEQLAIPTLQSFYPFTNAWCDSVVQPQQITWNVLTGKSSILDGNGNLIQQGYMTPQDNFFDNADYRQGAINQRGETSYTTSGAKTYTIDGWYIENSGSNLGVGTSFISVVGTFGRRINIVKENETYLAFTIQINLEKAQTIVIDTTTLNEGQDYTYQVDDNITFGIFFFSGQNYAWTYITCINNANIDFMKLERGHKFTGMPVWNYALEYLKCCRLLYVWYLPEIPSHGYNSINNLSYFTGTAFPVPFVSTPTFTVKQLLMDQVDVSSDLNTINVTPNRCTSISLTGQISTISGTIIFSNEPS